MIGVARRAWDRRMGDARNRKRVELPALRQSRDPDLNRGHHDFQTCGPGEKANGGGSSAFSPRAVARRNRRSGVRISPGAL